MSGAPSIIATSRLAELTGVSATTLHRWGSTDPAWRRCLVRVTKRKWWWSVAKLTESGFLTRTNAHQSQPSSAVLVATWPISRTA